MVVSHPKYVSNAKLFPPRPRHVLSSRLRLLRPLLAPVTLIQAPAGFGKTTLALQLAEFHKLQLAWLTLDARDNDPPVFWQHLVSALLRIASDRVPDRALAGLDPLDQVEQILNRLTETERSAVLVLDDFHQLNQPLIMPELNRLLDFWPQSLHLVITSRSMPDLRVAHRKSKLQLVDITVDALRFTPAESEQFFAAQGVDHDQCTDFEELLERAEGWVAALQLACTRIRSRRLLGAVEGQIKLLPAVRGDIYQLLLGEVLRQQDSETLHILAVLALLPSFCADLLQHLVVDCDAAVQIGQLQAQQLFIMPLDEAGQWYRFHDLFRTLVSEQCGLPWVQAQRLRTAAGEWFEARDLQIDALDQFIEAQAWDAVVRVAHHITRMWDIENNVTTIRRLKLALPDEVFQHDAKLMALYAWVMPSQERVRTGDALIERAHQLLEQQDLQNDTESLRICVTLYSLQALNARVRQDWSAVETYSRRALALAESGAQEQRWRSYMTLGTCYYLQGRLPEAEIELERAYTLVRTAPDHLKNLAYVSGYLIEVLMLRGKLRRAGAVAEATRLHLESTPLMQSRHAAWRYIGHADVMRERNQVDAARKQANALLALRRQPSLDLIEHVALLNAAFQVALSTRDYTSGEHLLKEWEQCLALAGNMSILATGSVAGMRADLALRCSQLPSALAWLREFQFHDAMPFTQLPDALVAARIMVTTGEYQAALPLLARLKKRCETDGAERMRFQCDILQAMALADDGKTPAAQHHLAGVLESLHGEGFTRLLLDEGAAFMPLLAGLNTPPSLHRYKEELLQALAREAGSATGTRLSERESEILRLARTGKSDKEIARELAISYGTVKTHLRNAFRKLGVNKRIAALEKFEQT